MKKYRRVFCLAFILCICGCEKTSENATDINVEFTWGEMKECGMGNPEVHFNGIPNNTKFLKFEMYDHVYTMDHGKKVVPYNGETTFNQGFFPKIVGPCPTSDPGRYEITIKALDENKVIIGIGSKERYYPENT